ncbi:MAG: hypothetical protein WEC75_10715 [Dehalococcoidia bacterium]
MTELSASVRGKNAIAADAMVEQSVTDLSTRAASFLRRVHDGKVADARAEAEMHLHALREFVRRTGVDLEALSSWRANTASWRAVSRIARPAITSEQRA